MIKEATLGEAIGAELENISDYFKQADNKTECLQYELFMLSQSIVRWSTALGRQAYENNETL